MFVTERVHLLVEFRRAKVSGGWLTLALRNSTSRSNRSVTERSSLAV